MMVLSKVSDTDYKLVEADSVIEATIDSIVKPLTLQPVSGGQCLLFSAIALTGGVCLGTALGHKIPLIKSLSPVTNVKSEQISLADHEFPVGEAELVD